MQKLMEALAFCLDLQLKAGIQCNHFLCFLPGSRSQGEQEFAPTDAILKLTAALPGSDISLGSCSSLGRIQLIREFSLLHIFHMSVNLGE